MVGLLNLNVSQMKLHASPQNRNPIRQLMSVLSATVIYTDEESSVVLWVTFQGHTQLLVIFWKLML